MSNGSDEKQEKGSFLANLSNIFSRDNEKQFVKHYAGEETWVAAVSYFPFVSPAVILLRKNNSEFVSFHAHQALVILVMGLVVFIVVPSVAKLIVIIVAYTLLVYGAYRALQGRKWYLPLITELANTIDL